MLSTIITTCEEDTIEIRSASHGLSSLRESRIGLSTRNAYNNTNEIKQNETKSSVKKSYCVYNLQNEKGNNIYL